MLLGVGRQRKGGGLDVERPDRLLHSACLPAAGEPGVLEGYGQLTEPRGDRCQPVLRRCGQDGLQCIGRAVQAAAEHLPEGAADVDLQLRAVRALDPRAVLGESLIGLVERVVRPVDAEVRGRGVVAEPRGVAGEQPVQ